MSRPLMQHGVGQLEALFASSKSDSNVLKQLEHELQHRKVPRASALLGEVQAAMGIAAPSGPPTSAPASSRTTPNQQPELWERSSVSRGVDLLDADLRRPLVSQVEPPKPTEMSRPSTPDVAVMPISVAYKVLKATPGSTWDSIEQTRRKLVQLSHPSSVASLTAEERKQVQEEAKRVNTAYAVLWRNRAGAAQ